MQKLNGCEFYNWLNKAKRIVSKQLYGNIENTHQSKLSVEYTRFILPDHGAMRSAVLSVRNLARNTGKDQ